jgi:hypothetical protein
MRFKASAFREQERKGLLINADSELQIDVTMTMTDERQELTIFDSPTEVQPEMVSTQMGDVVTW